MSTMCVFRRSVSVSLSVCVFVALYLSTIVPGCVSILCDKETDPVYKGLKLSCSDRHLSLQDISQLEHKNTTTTLVLNGNPIATFENDTFWQFKELRRLDCEWCNLHSLHVEALKGLGNLEELHLENNNLKIEESRFPKGMFNDSPNIRILHIGHNGNSGPGLNYSRYLDIFDSLASLEDLSIDSFDHLMVGDEFRKLDNLRSLTVVCENIQSFSNESLHGLADSNITHFSLTDGTILNSDIGLDMFQYLHNVSSLVVNNFQIGHQNMLRMMKPLKGRRMEALVLRHDDRHHNGGASATVKDGIISPDSLQFVTAICVSHFEWVVNDMFSIELDFSSFSVWSHCLKSITFSSRTPIFINSIFWLMAIRFKRLERVVLKMINKNDYQSEMNGHFYNVISSSTHGTKRIQVETTADYSTLNVNPDYSNKKEKFSHSSLAIVNTTPIHDQRGNLSVGIPPNMKSIIVEYPFCISLEDDFIFKKNNLESLSLRYGGKLNLDARLFNLTKLTMIDLTSTSVTGRDISCQTFTQIKKFILKKTFIESDFLKRCIDFLPKLEHLDISDNQLQWLLSGMFVRNEKLKYLNLAGNRFSAVPFSLSTTPHIEMLDLRENSISKISKQDLDLITKHIYNTPNFTLLLSGNMFSCACSNIFFMGWVRDHRAYLDQDGNYTCMSQFGELSYTGAYADIEGFWRQCQGQYYFLVSLLLTATMMSVLLATFLGMKHRTYILSSLLRLLDPAFRTKQRGDFAYDVCIGYADQDWHFVRHVLTRYLEDSLGLRTFVHQRDLRQDPLLFYEIIRDSYRNILLITENFLYHYETAHNVMKTSTFFVNVSNPRRVVVLVTEDVQHLIPDYVLRTVDEENIIILPPLPPPPPPSLPLPRPYYPPPPPPPQDHHHLLSTTLSAQDIRALKTSLL